MSAEWVDRYLALLGVQPAAPDLQLLGRLTRRHLSQVRFENVTSMLRRRARPRGPVPALDLEAVLDNWTSGRGGGLCFEVTEMLGTLLRKLGYQAHPVLAQISFPGSHQALVVELDRVRYLVDVGNGAPLFEPIPLHETFEVRHAGLGYRFRAEADTCVQERWIDEAWKPFARYELWPAEPAAREQAYQRHHVLGQSWVVDNVVLIGCETEQVNVLRDRQLTRFTRDGKHVQPAARADYPR